MEQRRHFSNSDSLMGLKEESYFEKIRKNKHKKKKGNKGNEK
jgi:hypothetical protein